MIKKYLEKNKGITGTDLVVSIVILVTFTGLVTSLMRSLYKTSAEIQRSSIAMAYATIISEKIDEKSFEEVSNNGDFCEYLKSKGEIEISDEYKITVEQSPIDGLDFGIIKNMKIVVSYKVANEEKKISIAKLKVKEIEK